MADAKQLKMLGVAAVAMVSFATISLVGIAVVEQFKANALINATVAQYFVDALAIFGSFSSIIALGLIAKVLIAVFRGNE